MNICMLAYTFYENDNRVRRYAETLAKRGDLVDVISIRRPEQSSYEFINGVKVYRIQKRIINEKNKFTYLLRVLLFFIKSSYYVSIKHLSSPYQLIHVHNPPDFEVFAAWLPKLMGAKIILDIHDIVPEFYASKFNTAKNSILLKILVLIEKVSISFVDRVIVSNHIWSKKVISRSVKKEKCLVVLNYPDPSIFYKRSCNKVDNSFIMLYPGTLNWHQGLDIAIKALALIKEEEPKIALQIYGEGPEKQNLINLADELGLVDRIKFSDLLPLEDVADIMSNVDLGIVPKRKNSFGNEAFSTKIFEFLSLGVPVIISDTKIDKYYFNDSIVKFFQSGDERSLADCILTLKKNKDDRKRLSEEGLKYMKKNSWQFRKKEYLDLIDSLILEKT